MRVVSIICLNFVLYLSVFGTELDTCRIYYDALDLIMQKSDCDFNNCIVVDSVYDLDRIMVVPQLSNFPDCQSALEERIKNKHYLQYSTIYSECLNSLRMTPSRSSKYIIYFSQIEDSILIAELFNLYKLNYPSLCYENVALFTTCKKFTFLIAGDNICHYYVAEIQFN